MKFSVNNTEELQATILFTPPFKFPSGKSYNSVQFELSVKGPQQTKLTSLLFYISYYFLYFYNQIKNNNQLF